MNEIEAVKTEALDALAQAGDLEALQRWRSDHLGKSGRLPALLRRIPELPPEERPAFGQAVNRAKTELETALAAAEARLEAAALDAEIAANRIDVTLPGTLPPLGGYHPSTLSLRRIYAIFADMGFQVYQSRETEDDETNFELLNIPPNHPARDMQDTFYIDDDRLLRTHTSPGQIRAMRAYCPEPIRIILPGMCYRHEQITPRSEIQFYQVEGLAVGPGVTMADLKGTLTAFAQRMFGHDRRVRFRASYFPFTEPSGELDVACFLCDGEGCRLCKYSGWLEILGCGMVHPVVLANGGYDPETYTGFAFGMGVERMALLRHGVDDIRHFWANDARFLEQFR
jgi:phenylalanyl-tRNA synthetase alpha chain